MVNFFSLRDILIDVYEILRHNIRRNCSDRITTAYSCHVNWPIKIKFLYEKLFQLMRSVIITPSYAVLTSCTLTAIYCCFCFALDYYFVSLSLSLSIIYCRRLAFSLKHLIFSVIVSRSLSLSLSLTNIVTLSYTPKLLHAPNLSTRFCHWTVKNLQRVIQCFSNTLFSN